MNSFGHIFRLTTFGESHGAAVGGVIGGMPAGVAIDMDFVQHQLDRRRPGQSAITTARKEADRIEVLSGLFEGVTTGTPIGFMVRNADQRSADYGQMRHAYRPSHADYTYSAKYGVRDYRGGGRSSARETLARVAAGAMAMQVLKSMGIQVYAYTSQVGQLKLEAPYTHYDPADIDSNAVRCPDSDMALQMYELIDRVRSAGDTIGGVITGVVKGCPAGLGEPVGAKLHAMLGAAMLSINAVKGFDYGMGFDGVGSLGSEMNDTFVADGGHMHTLTNHSGGIQGGISNGEDIYFRVAFKPVATLMTEVPTVDDTGSPVTLQPRGRHDPCVLPRAVPVVESMAAMVILDAMLMNRCARI
ncbi:MAG: chorismate synthase [Muribaculaceae bacterium]|nr:chorismate synthase [Muribaculaceae bacterium]